jgi:uncharacterized protein YbaR (Trm112 family)
MKPEYWKLTLVVVLLAGAVGTYFWFGRTPPPLPSEVKFVCVATGEVFRIARERIPSFLPAKNPNTGERTLLPVVERDGKLFANERHAYGCLSRPEVAEVNKYVDPQTLEILATPRTP